MSITNAYKNQRLSAQIIEYNLNRKNIPEFRSRQSHCHFSINGLAQLVEMWKKPGAIRAYFKNLQTCGSVWSCNVCAMKISEYRKNEIAKLIKKAHAAGKYIYMFTWTLPHYYHESCSKVLEKFNVSTGKMKRQQSLKTNPYFKPWSVLMKEYKNDGYVITKEILFGQNGWHVHSHGLFIFDKKIENQLQAREDFFQVWLKACDLTFMLADSPDHILRAFIKRSFRLDHLSGDADKVISEYLTKSGVVKKEKELKEWKLEHEMTKGHLKKSESGLITPFGILDKIRQLDDPNSKQSKVLKQKFFEYTQALKGSSFVRFSPNLRSKYEIEWKSDEDIAQGETDLLNDFYGCFEVPEWKTKIIKNRLRGFLLQNSDKDWNTLVIKLNKKLKERKKNENSKTQKQH
jgi:hypothetical protein